MDWVERDYINPLHTPVKSPDIIVDDECSLADAIHSANRDEATGGCIAGDGPDTIRLSKDLTLQDALPDATSMHTLVDPLPDITSVIVIEGENRLLDADGHVAFKIKFGDLTINNLRLTNAVSNVFREFKGGAINLYFGRLRLNNSRITSSWAMKGAVIYSYDSDIVVNDSVLANNTAGGTGGVAYLYDGSLSIANSIISDNEGLDNGGAIYGRGSPSILISRSIISDNRTKARAAAFSLATASA